MVKYAAAFLHRRRCAYYNILRHVRQSPCKELGKAWRRYAQRYRRFPVNSPANGGISNALIFLLIFGYKGFAVSTLAHRGVRFVRTYRNGIQRAVIFLPTVVLALLNGAADALIGLAVIHCLSLLPFYFGGYPPLIV